MFLFYPYTVRRMAAHGTWIAVRTAQYVPDYMQVKIVAGVMVCLIVT